MSLRTMFGGTDDAVTIYRRDLVAAVKNGDADRLKELLASKIDAPSSVLNTALERAVSNDRLKMAEMILDAPGGRLLDNSTLRQVVYDGRSGMFRLLASRGFNFSAAVPGSDSAPRYMRELGNMQKDLQIAQLQEEVAALKTEIAGLKKTAPAAEPATAAPDDAAPRKFAL